MLLEEREEVDEQIHLKCHCLALLLRSFSQFLLKVVFLKTCWLVLLIGCLVGGLVGGWVGRSVCAGLPPAVPAATAPVPPAGLKTVRPPPPPARSECKAPCCRLCAVCFAVVACVMPMQFLIHCVSCQEGWKDAEWQGAAQGWQGTSSGWQEKAGHTTQT